MSWSLVAGYSYSYSLFKKDSKASMSICGVCLPDHGKNFPLRFIFVLANLEMKFVKRDWKWMTEEASDGQRMAGIGIGKVPDRQVMRFRIEIIPKKFMSSKMDGWFMSGRMAALMSSTKVRILPAFERQDMKGEEEPKSDIGGGFIKVSKF